MSASVSWTLSAGTHRKNDDEEEVYVGDVVKLEEQVLGDEAQGGVLGCPDLVPDKLLLPVALLVHLFLRQWDVHVDVARLQPFVLLLDTHGTVVRDVTMVLIVTVSFLFVCRQSDFGNSIQDGHPLSSAGLAGLPRGGPSLSLRCRFRHMAVVLGIGLVESDLGRHRQWRSEQWTRRGQGR
jgi:hypothetical protein